MNHSERIASIVEMLGGKKKKAKEANGKGFAAEEGSEGESSNDQLDASEEGGEPIHTPPKKKDHLFGGSPHRVNLMIAIAHAKKKGMK